MRSRRLLLSLATATTALCLSMGAHADTISAQDFVTKVSVSDKFEVSSSKLALDKSQNADVKAFAQKMVTDHTKTTKKLEATLKKSDSKATPADELDSEHQAMLDALTAKNGTDFDKLYVADQTDAHKQAVDLFSNYADNGSDKALKGFAKDTLPALKGHLKHAESLKAAK